MSLVLASVFGLLGLVPAAPAEAQTEPNPVLMVGGNFGSESWAEMGLRLWPEHDLDIYHQELATLTEWPILISLGWALLRDYFVPPYEELPQEYQDVMTPQEYQDIVDEYTVGYWPGSASNHVSAQVVENKVEDILDQTGADQVDIVGVSQGAAVARWYVEQLGGADDVGALISWDGASLGIPSDPDFEDLWDAVTPISDEPFPAAYCEMVMNPSTECQAQGGTDFLPTLNDPNDPLPSNVDYYHIYTNTEGGIPLTGPPFGPVTNVLIQEACPSHPLTHLEVYGDASSIELVLMALDRDPALNDPSTIDLPCN